MVMAYKKRALFGPGRISREINPSERNPAKKSELYSLLMQFNFISVPNSVLGRSTELCPSQSCMEMY